MRVLAWVFGVAPVLSLAACGPPGMPDGTYWVDDVVADVNLTAGESTILPLKGRASNEHPAEAYTFWAPGLRDDGLYVVSSPGDGVTQVPHELVRIHDDHLHVLDVTRKTDSRLRSFRLCDGELVGTKTFDALDPNFDPQLSVQDFVVTTLVEYW